MKIFKSLRHIGVSFLTNLGLLWLEKSITRAIQISFVLITLQFAGILIAFSEIPTKVPLFYSLPWGEDRLASGQMLFILPGLSLAILLVNTVISVFFIKSEKFISLCLAWSSCLTSLFSLITLFKIILLVT